MLGEQKKRVGPENTGLATSWDSSRNLLVDYRCISQLTCFAWRMITAGMEGDTSDQIATHLKSKTIATTILISSLFALEEHQRVRPLQNPKQKAQRPNKTLWQNVKVS